jgi:erythromycin esterase-like protein
MVEVRGALATSLETPVVDTEPGASTSSTARSRVPSSERLLDHQERWGNYVPTVLGRRYDALAWFDETRALDPLRPVEPERGELETWPFGA